jgi:hypothetical protein
VAPLVSHKEIASWLVAASAESKLEVSKPAKKKVAKQKNLRCLHRITRMRLSSDLVKTRVLRRGEDKLTLLKRPETKRQTKTLPKDEISDP